MGAPQTWHYGLVARWWAEFNDDGPEIGYFRRFVEAGQPALDVGCGTGRLLLPYLRDGLDVDGTDVSADMISLCREKAAREGLETNLYVQAMHELDLPRRYRTIYVCGVYGLGSTREQDLQALDRIYAHLEPGGTLVLDNEVPYAKERFWGHWRAEQRRGLPEEPREPSRKKTSDGAELALSGRILELDPLAQTVRLEMHAEQRRDGTLEAEERHTLTMNLYFTNELVLMLERAGFADVEVYGDHSDDPATPESEFVVLVAKKL